MATKRSSTKGTAKKSAKKAPVKRAAKAAPKARGQRKSHSATKARIQPARPCFTCLKPPADGKLHPVNAGGETVEMCASCIELVKNRPQLLELALQVEANARRKEAEARALATEQRRRDAKSARAAASEAIAQQHGEGCKCGVCLGTIVPGNPGNSGGKKGRSGRRPDALKRFYQRVVMSKPARVALKRALADSYGPAYGTALKTALAYGFGKPEQVHRVKGEIAILVDVDC